MAENFLNKQPRVSEDDAANRYRTYCGYDLLQKITNPNIPALIQLNYFQTNREQLLDIDREAIEQFALAPKTGDNVFKLVFEMLANNSMDYLKIKFP